MPVVSLQITAGSTREQRAEIVRRFTGTLVEVLGKRPEHTHIVIAEVAEDHWGYAGMLTDAFRKRDNGSGVSGT